jgi:endonuclease III
MLLFAASHLVLPVDARVSRVARRLGYGDLQADFRKTSRSVEAALVPELSRGVDAYRRAYLYLSHHGAVTCTEAEPHCGVCALLDDCPAGRRKLGIKN